MKHLLLIAALIFPTAVSAQQFTFNPPGDLEQSNRAGRNDSKVYVPDMRFPIEVAPAYANSQVYGVGGSGGPAGGQCDERNYSYPWSDNYCESRRWSMPLCPSGNGHQGQDIRASTCVDNVHWVVSAEAGTVTSIGSYSVVIVSDAGTQHRYLHMEPSSLRVNRGETVSKGQRIGRVSNAFFSNGNRVPTTIHLHYDINQNIPSAGGAVYVPTYLSLVRSYETLIGQEAEPCQIIAAEGGVVDNSGDCFFRYGNDNFWREVSGSGVENGYIWTNAWENATPGNWAQWFLHFAEAGTYRVEAKMNPPHNVSTRARYLIRADGQDNEQVVDQSSSDDWLSLGEYAFAEGGSQRVDVFDNTGETASDQHLTVDAIRLTRIDGDPDPDPDPDPNNVNPNNTNPNNTNPNNDPDRPIFVDDPTQPGPITDPFLNANADDIRVQTGCCATSKQPTPWLLFVLVGFLVARVRRRS